MSAALPDPETGPLRRLRPDFGGILRPPYLKYAAVLCLGIALHGFNELSVAPLLPRALADLDRLPYLPWSYALFYTAVIAGGVTASALRARLGARGAILMTAVLYLVSILLCATAPSGETILAGRALQGLSDGWIAALGYGLIPEMFGTSRVSRVVALATVVWSGFSVLGPTVSGVTVDLLGWRAGFALSVPIVLALILVAALYAPTTRGGASERLHARQLRTLALSLGAILLLMLPSALPEARIGFLLSGLGLCLLCVVLRRDAGRSEPLIPRQLFRLSNTVGLGSWVLLLITAGQSISTVFLAFVLEIVFDLPARGIGLLLIVLPLSWVISAFPTGQVQSLPLLRQMLRFGPRWQSVGVAGVIAGLTTEHLWMIVIGQCVIGLGLGTIWGPLNHAMLLSAQERDRGRIASLIPSISTLGYVFGSALGSLMAAQFHLFDLAAGTDALPDLVILGLWGMVFLFSFAAAVLILRVRPEGDQPEAAEVPPMGAL